MGCFVFGKLSKFIPRVLSLHSFPLLDHSSIFLCLFSFFPELIFVSMVVFFPESVIVLENKAKCYPARAESARAVTGRRCPHSGVGEDFLALRLCFFTKTAVTRKRNVEKLIPRLIPEGYKRALCNLGLYGQKNAFRPNVKMAVSP